MYLPINSKNIKIECHIPEHRTKEDVTVELEINLPCSVLLQKLDFQLDDQFQKEDFAKVFLLTKLFRQQDNSSKDQQFAESLILSQNKQLLAYKPKPQNANQSALASQIDLELEALRNEVLNCANSSVAEEHCDKDPSKHSIRVCSVGTNFKMIMKVSENFGIDLSSAKEHPNKDLQEDLRSLSRTLQSKTEDESDLSQSQVEEGKIQNCDSIKQIQTQTGLIQRKNSESFSKESLLQQKLSPTNNNLQSQSKQSRNFKQKQHQSFLEKAVVLDNQTSTKTSQDEEYLKLKLIQEQQRAEQKRNAEKIFKRAFQQIVQGLRFYCWPCFRVPQANNLIPLINTSFLLNQANKNEEKKDIDFMIGLSMVSGRKFIQAAEQFRKLQLDILKQDALNQQDVEKCIQFELLIADAMNQHSQLPEKLNALKRAVDLHMKQRPKNDTALQSMQMIREEEAQRFLMMLHPQLIKILISNLESKLESIKVAALRLIEYLIDQLGCSLDKCLVQILFSIIHTYPRSNLHFNHQVIQNQSLPIRYGFYQQQLQPSAFLQMTSTTYNFDNAIYSSYMDSILYDQFLEQNIQIKDGLTFQQTYQINIKNLNNHILESFIQLLSSMSSSSLQLIFNEILQKCIFLGSNPYENQLATDLRIYLIKFADKIISICQGDLILNLNFINNLTQVLVPDQRKLQNAILGSAYTQNINSLNQVEIAKAKQKTSETISLACQNLWQTCREKLFINYSSKGLKIIIEWTLDNLISLTENCDNLSQYEQQKLSMVFDIIDLLTQSLPQNKSDGQQSPTSQQDKLNDLFGTRLSQANHQIQSLSGRETRITNSRLGDKTNLANENNTPKNQTQPSLIQSKTKSLATLEIYVLLNPVLFWLDFSLEKLERLTMFKMIWKTLTKIMSVLPNDQIDIDLVTIILPVLEKVNLFCQSSSPQLEMLQFLQIILQDLKTVKTKNKECNKFLDSFLVTVSKSIPHNLHEEIFGVCESLLELMKDNLKDYHVQGIIEALCDKYTMRSKAHKRLTSYFIQLIISSSTHRLNQSIQNQNLINQQQQEIRQNISQNQMQMNQSTQQQQQQQHIQPDFIDNYEYERDSNEYADEDEENSDTDQNNNQYNYQQRNQRNQNFQAVPITNQIYQESPISQRVFHQATQNQNQAIPEVRQFNQANRNTLLLTQTLLDNFIDVSLIKNILELTNRDKYRDQVCLELHFEKLTLLNQLLKQLNFNNIQLFTKVINKHDFKDSIIRVFMNDRTHQVAFEFLDTLSTFYLANSAPKNIYEHQSSILNFAQFNQNDMPFQRPINNNQTSQSSGGHQQNFLNSQHLNRESSRTSFLSSQHPNNNLGLNIRNQFSQSQNQIQFPQHLQGIMPQQILRYQQQNNIDDELMIENLNDDIIQDEVDLINRERLIIIQLHAIFIRQYIKRFESSQDGNIQLSTLVLLDNLFTNLMPVPTFQNQMIKLSLQRNRIQPGGQINADNYAAMNQSIFNQRPRVHHYEIPDIEQMVIIDHVQTYQQLISQQQNLPAGQWQSFIYQEFETTDLKYLHSRLDFAIKIWNFLESSLVQSSWSNIKSISYGIICQILKIDISEYKQAFQNKVKQLLYPLLNNLLFSKDSESKAGGLNIIGSFCGLGHDFTQAYHYQLHKNLHNFKKNSSIISLALWQQVFNLQEDWDSTIRDAAIVLIQICAPRESVKHFNKIEIEKYQLKYQTMLKTHNLLGNQEIRNKIYQGGQISNAQNSVLINQSESVEEFKIGQELIDSLTSRTSILDQRKSIFRNYLQSNQSIRSTIGSQLGHNQQERLNSQRNQEDQVSSSSDETVIVNDHLIDEGSDEYFFVDCYSEDQIKSLIAIFKNDYKPPKSLWIEKNQVGTNYNNIALGSEYIDLNSQRFEGDQNNAIDIFEDKIVDRLNSLYLENNKNGNQNLMDSFQSKNQSNVNGDSDYLIFERHFEEKDKLQQQQQQLLQISGSGDKSKIAQDPLSNIDINQEDLGIIDLDEEDGGEGFDELDDEKLPVLKNTYSKKNRPNNSKSVAIGSRTQELRKTQSSQSEVSQQQQQQQIKSEIREPNAQILENQNQEIVEVQSLAPKAYKQQKGMIFDSDEEDDQYEQLDLDNLSQSDQSAKNVKDQDSKRVVDHDLLIMQYEQKIAQTINDLNTQLSQTQQITSPVEKPQYLQIAPQVVEVPLIQITGTVKTQKKSDELPLKSTKLKTNKSFDLKQRKHGGLQSPFKAKDYSSNIISSGDQEFESQIKSIVLSQPSSNNTTQRQIRKINDSLSSYQKKKYSSQGKNLKPQVHQTALKKDSSTYSKPQLLSTTSPGTLNSSLSNPQTTKQSMATQSGLSTSKNLALAQFAPFSQSNAQSRKRKSDYQRKSEVPPYSSLTQKKFANSSLSQNNNQLASNQILEQRQQDAKQQSYTQNDVSSQSSKTNNQIGQLSQQNQTLMQKAQQAFVSRAKSQSYLNSVTAINNASQNSVTSSINLQKKKDTSSFKYQSNLNNLTQQSIGKHKSFTSSLYQPKQVKKSQSGRRVVKLTQTNDDLSNSSMLNSACSGGNIPQAHRGYFSNDECEKVVTSGKVGQCKIKEFTIGIPIGATLKRQIISPPRSGDLHFRVKNSLSSDGDAQIKGRPSSHNLKNRKPRQISQLDEIKTHKINLLLRSQDKNDVNLLGDLLQEKPNKRIKKSKRYVKKDSIDSLDQNLEICNLPQQKSVEQIQSSHDLNFYPQIYEVEEHFQENLKQKNEKQAKYNLSIEEDIDSNHDSYKRIEPKGKYSNQKRGQLNLYNQFNEVQQFDEELQDANQNDILNDQDDDLMNDELDDVEEFISGDENSANQMRLLGQTQAKQLSCIDEEEDMSERRTISMHNGNGNNIGQDFNNQSNQMNDFSVSSSLVNSAIKPNSNFMNTTGVIDINSIMQQNIGSMLQTRQGAANEHEIISKNQPMSSITDSLDNKNHNFNSQ